MVNVTLTVGTHVIKWTLSGYRQLIANVVVAADGTVTCSSITSDDVAVPCDATGTPSVGITGSVSTGYTITGYMAAVTSGVTSFAAWVASMGGSNDISKTEVLSLVLAYTSGTYSWLTKANVLTAVGYATGV